MTLRERADRAFSIYIRQSMADFQGYVSCYTCGIILPWQECDAGHFNRREFSATRYDEMNVKPQCQECNRTRGGMTESFEEHLREDYGDVAVDDLIRRGQEEKRFTDEEYQQLIHKCEFPH